jgi:tRNA A37 threonylcarbamoyladenosine biosynthesis protein TsaE
MPVLVVEWGERLPAELRASAIVVRISDPGEDRARSA